MELTEKSDDTRRTFILKAAAALLPLTASNMEARPLESTTTSAEQATCGTTDPLTRILSGIASGDDDSVLAQLRVRPDLIYARDHQGQSLLLIAQLSSRPKIVEHLLGAGVAMDAYEAAALGDLNRLQELLSTAPGLIRLPNAKGDSPAHLAALCGKTEIIGNTMLYGEDFNQASSRDGATLMHIGVANPSASIAEDIAFSSIGNGGNPALVLGSGESVLHIAARMGHARVVRLCIERGADPLAKDSQGQTAVMISRQLRNSEVAQELEKRPPIRSTYYAKRLTQTRDFQCHNWTEPKGLSQDMVNHTVLYSHFGFDEVKRMIGMCPALVNGRSSWDEFPVEAAAHMGRTDMADYLLDHGALYSICTATVLGDKASVERLLREDRECVGERGAHHYPVLWYTAFGTEQLELAELLISRGADVGADIRGRTILHIAAAAGHAKLCRLLLEHGADPTQRGITTDGEMTPAELAIKRDHPEIERIFSGWPAKVQ